MGGTDEEREEFGVLCLPLISGRCYSYKEHNMYSSKLEEEHNMYSSKLEGD